ncbi:pilus assembly PilX family protein [Pseudidiomarina aquimaris]|uniref:pilus assembly PilX family protein n=1 Tax=Pseudidiomarina aquimaris TaxID=641841 RepID=UPI003A96AA19
MCHKIPRIYSVQRGAALAIALFVLLIVALLGLTLVRALNDSANAVASDVLGTRAQLAAQSGVQLLMTELYPLDAGLNTSVCPARVSNEPPVVRNYTFSADGLTQCSTSVRCSQLQLNSPYSGTHIRIIAEGSCNGGDFTYSKRILVEVGDGIQ